MDIQPIAVQISKLRFFISLIVDQRLDVVNPSKDVQPLPNLETKFVAANTLLRPNAGQLVLKSDKARLLERELFDVRRRHFSARKWSDKKQFRSEDERLRTELAEELILTGMPEGDAHKLAHWNPYDQSSFAPFFDAEWMFGPSLKDGFYIIIGTRHMERNFRKKIRQI